MGISIKAMAINTDTKKLINMATTVDIIADISVDTTNHITNLTTNHITDLTTDHTTDLHIIQLLTRFIPTYHSQLIWDS